MKLLPRPQTLRRDGYKMPVRRVLVLTRGPNPTFSYYIESRLAELGDVPYVVRSIDGDGLSDLDTTGLFVVICRYIRHSQISWLARHRNTLAGVALLVDDDIAGTVVDKSAPFKYRAKLARLACFPLLPLNHLLSDLWVSTPELQQRLTDVRSTAPVLLEPAPLISDQSPTLKEKDGRIKLAFYSTGAHRAEHLFLRDIVRRVLARYPGTVFEVVVTSWTEAIWTESGIDPDQLRLLRQMRWPDFKNYTQTEGADILLAPLMPGRVNDARSDTKRIDCFRLGAAGIYSQCEVYGRNRHPDEIFADNTVDSWLGNLSRMIDDKSLRESGKAGTQAVVRVMASRAAAGLPLLLQGARGVTLPQ